MDNTVAVENKRDLNPINDTRLNLYHDKLWLQLIHAYKIRPGEHDAATAFQMISTICNADKMDDHRWFDWVHRPGVGESYLYRKILHWLNNGADWCGEKVLKVKAAIEERNK